VASAEDEVGGPAVAGHAHEVVGAAQKGGEGRDERRLAARGEAEGGPRDALLGDVAFEEPLGERLLEAGGPGGVHDVVVERHSPGRRARP
jgi:hypothetical protein